MKALLLLFGILITTTNCISRQSDFNCPCSKIGLDPVWADSNKVTCYLIPVLRDISNKAKGKFLLAAVVAPALNKNPDKPLLYLHGGPGIATIENVPRYLKTKAWEILRENRPLIFFDYRGTGFSEPSLCPDLKDSLLAFTKINSSPDANQSYKQELFKKCRTDLASKNIDVSAFNSYQISEDAEAIRSALKIDSWNVYGVSYGTTVALNLLRDHDKKIRSMILDSPFPPNAPWLDFVRPFDTAFKVLERNIESDPATREHFPNLRNDFVNAVNRLNKKPVKLKVNDKTETDYSGDSFAWGIWSAMLKPKAIPFVPLFIKEVSNGNDSVLLKWFTAFNDPDAFGTFSDLQSKAVLCYEGKPRTESDTKSALLKKYPDLSAFNLDFENDLCEVWQPEGAKIQMFDAVKSDVPVLILSGEYDPVCPPLFGELAGRTLSNAAFITVPSASHAVIHVNDCTRNMADRFLTSPEKKPEMDCIRNIKTIKFITGNLTAALSEYKK